MNSAVLALIGLICFGLGYKYYSRFIEKKIYGLNVEYAENAEEALKNCEACIVATEWSEFRNLNLFLNKEDLIIIDGRRILDYQLLSSSIIYYGVGYLIQNHRN